MSDMITTNDACSGVPETLPISINQYETLVNAGAFPNVLGQVELVRGRIVRMNPQGPEHADPIDVLSEWSFESIQRRFTVRIEKPIRIPDQLSCPEPDIAWATRKRYSREHPSSAEIHLVIEVSQSSTVFDRTEKMELYASAGIPEYWQVDVPSRTVTVYRDPQNGSYRSIEEFPTRHTLEPLCLPDAKLAIASLFAEH